MTARIRYAELVDVDKLQALMQSCNEVIAIANAVIDVDGTVIVHAGWQDACTKFHRCNAETCRRCIESDTSLVGRLTQGAPYAVYDCLNGLVDTAAPILVDGEHVANVFTGQFLTAPPDIAYFRRQAQQAGFDEGPYLEAIARLPIVPLERVEAITRLYAQLAGMLADGGMDRLRQQRATEQLTHLNKELELRVAARTDALASSERRFRNLFERNGSVMLIVDPASGEIVDANATAAGYYGYPREILAGMAMNQINCLSPADLAGEMQRALHEERNYFNFSHRLASGEIRHVEVYSNPIEMDGRDLLVSIVHDITERKLLQFTLEQQAHFDYLTAVNNRGYFMHLAEQELARAKRYGGNMSIFMLDIDFFKQVNDTHGHKVGDSVLKHLANVCRQTLREVDIIGRLGGEEFAILLPETTVDVASDVAQRLRTVVAGTRVPMENGLPVRFTVSIGVVSLAARDDNLDVLLSLADTALYEAKKAGRNRVCVAASPEPVSRV